jgi:hypothetical protein
MRRPILPLALSHRDWRPRHLANSKRASACPVSPGIRPRSVALGSQRQDESSRPTSRRRPFASQCGSLRRLRSSASGPYVLQRVVGFDARTFDERQHEGRCNSPCRTFHATFVHHLHELVRQPELAPDAQRQKLVFGQPHNALNAGAMMLPKARVARAISVAASLPFSTAFAQPPVGSLIAFPPPVGARQYATQPTERQPLLLPRLRPQQRHTPRPDPHVEHRPSNQPRGPYTAHRRRNTASGAARRAPSCPGRRSWPTRPRRKFAPAMPLIKSLHAASPLVQPWLGS